MLRRMFLYERSKVHCYWDEEYQRERCEFCRSYNVLDNGDTWLCMDCFSTWE